MKRKLFYSLILGMFGFSGASAVDYGLPAGIQEGNILHCFNWTAAEIQSSLPEIAAAGFGTVQMSPLQRPDVKVGSPWHNLYRPYDLAFKSSSYCSEEALKSLCTEAAKYGIKIIVDVVANHVDKTAGYHDSWWDANGRVRWNGGINYGDRYSITHGQLGDYGDINSEDAQVIARGKAYVEKLKSLGVKGCRWDAAKHIGLPSEGCNFWKEVTSVPGMYHYGEILDNPGPNPSIIKEYTTYMSVTDNEYCNYAAKSNGGIPGGYGGAWVVNQGCPDTKMVYWAESHDTYSNEDWSQNVSQDVIDRAYAAYACRNGATALYLARPNAKGFNNIKVGKGSTAFKGKHVAEVNKFRNLMVGKKDWFESNGNACSITRQNGGAVIVTKGSGNVSIANGGGFCPAGTYKDRVSGGTFTVTASTISGNVGSSGIAVIYADGITPPVIDPDDPTVPDDPITPPVSASYYVLGDIEGAAWSTTNGASMTPNGSAYTAKSVKLTAASGESKCFFNITDALGADWDELNMVANRYGAASEGASITIGTPVAVTKYANGVDASGCLSWSIAPGTYDITFDPSAMKVTVVTAGDAPIVDPITPPVVDPDEPTGDHYIYYDGTFSTPTVWAWTSSDNCNSNGTWPGDKMVKKNGKWYWEVPAGKQVPEHVIISENGGEKAGGGDLNYVDKATYHQDGNYTEAGDEPINPPVIDPVDPTGEHYIYFDGTFSTPTVWAWTSSANCNSNGSWPGDQMVKKNGKWYWEVPAGKSVPEQVIISENGGEKAGGGDLNYVDKATYHQDGSYTAEGDDPIIGPDDPINPPIDPDDPVVPVTPGKALNTNYYKVNPNGQVGSNRTVKMNFSEGKSTTALSNWTAADLVAQGVARDVCQAFKGVHERPIVDSYALYAAYDSQNLYLGVQYVYTVWDIGGEGKQPGESKPYNMDGKLMIAFDLDPNKSAKGTVNNGTASIWFDNLYTTFDNGSDAWWLGSTKPGTGTPGFFVPTATGSCEYTDPNSCKPSSVKYGYADGLLPSINAVYGQGQFGYDPSLLEGNTGFVDLRGEIADTAHTFYEYTFPLSMLGVTESYIRSYGIGVMVVDLYGSSAHGSLPYDPSFYDNVFESYSQDVSSSKEKEDQDVVTYSHARVGGSVSTGVENIEADMDADATPVYYNLQGVKVANPESGLYIMVKGKNVSKVLIK